MSFTAFIADWAVSITVSFNADPTPSVAEGTNETDSSQQPNRPRRLIAPPAYQYYLFNGLHRYPNVPLLPQVCCHPLPYLIPTIIPTHLWCSAPKGVLLAYRCFWPWYLCCDRPTPASLPRQRSPGLPKSSLRPRSRSRARAPRADRGWTTPPTTLSRRQHSTAKRSATRAFLPIQTRNAR